MPKVNADAALGFYIRGYIRLQRMIAEGAGDTEEADFLRDDVDEAWHAMKSARRKLANWTIGLIADAFSQGIPKDLTDADDLDDAFYPDGADGA